MTKLTTVWGRALSAISADRLASIASLRIRDTGAPPMIIVVVRPAALSLEQGEKP